MTQQYQDEVLALLKRILAAIIEPPRRPHSSADEQMIVRRVRVLTATSVATGRFPVQGPDVAIIPGFAVTIRQRNHVGTPVGGVGFSRNAVMDTQTRVELNDGDSITVRISNFNKAWFISDTADTDFEMIAVS